MSNSGFVKGDAFKLKNGGLVQEKGKKIDKYWNKRPFYPIFVFVFNHQTSLTCFLKLVNTASGP